ncbi:ciliary microtubule associated protein 1B-like [Centroberyx affinis]|uniref:ciliary microtubule associated protein 1B-like n=1 Tax=Centroberyx affinis TaxID=166261 RepID=UPI003A5C09FF
MPGTDVCVGSWRPHKPRGPIAAHYGSPGPKYALPGLIGIKDHDSRKQKAPAYSFGTPHSQLTSDRSPGPKYLLPSNITRVGRDGTPAFSLYSRINDPLRFHVPGPGKYSPERATKLTFKSSPAHSLSARNKEICNDHTPGPAAYMLPSVLGPNTLTTTTAPGYSLHGRSNVGSFQEDLWKTPGPGTYKVVDPCCYKYKAPRYSMIGRNSICDNSTEKPGPGAHYPERVTFTRIKAPSFSFGVRHSEYIVPLIANVAE